MELKSVTFMLYQAPMSKRSPAKTTSVQPNYLKRQLSVLQIKSVTDWREHSQFWIRKLNNTGGWKLRCFSEN